jgi:hypothetical protein
MHLNKGNRWEGKGGMGRVWGFSLLPTKGKSGREFAPRHKEGTSKSVKEGSSNWEGIHKQQKGVANWVVGMRLKMYIVLIKDCV